MYNYVDYECACPVCHAKVDGFQTKDGDLFFDTVMPERVANFYTSCGKCGCWIEFTRNDAGEWVRTVEGEVKDEKHNPLPEYEKVVSI